MTDGCCDVTHVDFRKVGRKEPINQTAMRVNLYAHERRSHAVPQSSSSYVTNKWRNGTASHFVLTQDQFSALKSDVKTLKPRSRHVAKAVDIDFLLG